VAAGRLRGASDIPVPSGAPAEQTGPGPLRPGPGRRPGPGTAWPPGSLLRRALWWAPALFLVHNTEEGVAMVRWAARDLPGLVERARAAIPPDLLPPPAADLLARFQPPPATEFAWSAALATILPALVYWAGARRGPRSRLTALAVWLQAMFLLNVFVPHLAATLWLRRYTPGVVSAVLLNLPLSWVVLRAALREGVVSRRGLVLFGLSAVLGYGILGAALLVLRTVVARVLGG